MDEQTARALAKDILNKMLEPLFSSPVAQEISKKEPRPITLLELIYTGAYFTRSMVELGLDPLDAEIYSIFATFPPDQGKVEDFLFRRIIAEKEKPDEIIEARRRIEQFTKPGSYRRVFISLFKEAVPGGAPGRTKKIGE